MRARTDEEKNMSMSRDQAEIDLVVEAKKALLDATKESAEGGLSRAALEYATAYAILHYGKLPGGQPESKG